MEALNAIHQVIEVLDLGLRVSVVQGFSHKIYGHWEHEEYDFSFKATRMYNSYKVEFSEDFDRGIIAGILRYCGEDIDEFLGEEEENRFGDMELIPYTGPPIFNISSLHVMKLLVEELEARSP